MGSKTALLAWELGGGLGHARRLLTLALSLKRRGWSPVVAARELWACAGEYRRAGISVIQAPMHRGLGVKESARFRARGFADIMAACGYGCADDLLPVVLAWDHLIDILRPAAVIADYSPVLALAAHDRVPAIAIGDGFVLPPPHLPQMPVLRAEGTCMAHEHELLTNAATVQSLRGRAAPRSLPALIGGQAHVVCTYPDSDIYSRHRLQPASGPIGESPPPLARPAKAAVFAYLSADCRSTPKLLHVLANSGFPVEAFVRDMPEEMKRALRASRIYAHDAPPPLAEVAKRASVIVHHAGIGTIEACLALGRPQVLLPRHLEQSLNAATLIRLGTALAMDESFSLAEGSAIIAEAVGSKRLAERARDTAEGLVGRPSQALDEIIAHCEMLAGGT